MRRGSSLYRNLLTYQLYGANTDVGKTIFATILSKAFAKTRKLWYLKPVSTGPKDEADDVHVTRFAKGVETRCLWQFGEAVSPHIAASVGKNSREPPSDKSIVDSVLEHLESCSKLAPDGEGVVLLETAGGVHSPTPSGTSQADLYRPLRLPIFLVADPKLGGISSTISAFESLHVRGYDLDSILVFQEEKYKNYDYLSEYFQKRSIGTISLPPPPPRRRDIREDEEELGAYYEKVSSLDVVQEFLATSKERHDARIERLESMSSKAHQSIWYPFTQHQDLTPDKILTIDSASGDFFQTLSSPQSSSNAETNVITERRDMKLQPTFDGSASWWTQGLGHGSPDLSLAAAYAAGRYGHVMFAGAVHEPALTLAELLIKHLENPRLKKVFYSDDGSTGMEVAVKMALTASSKRYGWDISGGKSGEKAEVGILGLKGSYHGDTIGAMDCSEGSTYNEKVHWYKGRGYWFNFPQVKMKKGTWVVESPTGMEDVFGPQKTFGSLDEIFDIGRDGSEMKERYENYISETLVRLVKDEGMKFGALVLEPIILGAGGMLFCDPLFQRTLVNVVRSNPQLLNSNPSRQTLPTPTNSHTWSGLPIIHDEVFTGIYRLGTFTPSTLLHVHPDISVHAKLLTGGLLPLCTTVASESIFEAFLGEEKSEALLHGHSYTAHAVGCHVAVKSLETMRGMEERGVWDGYKRDWASAPRPSVGAEDPATSSRKEGSENARLWSVWSRRFVEDVSCADNVESVIALGSVLAISLRDSENAGYTSTAASGLQKVLLEGRVEEEFNVHSRVLGNVLYLMTSLTSENETVRRIERRLRGALSV